MNLKGQIIYKETMFEYELLNKQKVLIITEEPTKLNVVKSVRERVQREIRNRVVLRNEVTFNFKSQPKNLIDVL